MHIYIYTYTYVSRSLYTTTTPRVFAYNVTQGFYHHQYPPRLAKVQPHPSSSSGATRPVSVASEVAGALMPAAGRLSLKMRPEACKVGNEPERWDHTPKTVEFQLNHAFKVHLAPKAHSACKPSCDLSRRSWNLAPRCLETPAR